jgi:hypothetical protein
MSSILQALASTCLRLRLLIVWKSLASNPVERSASVSTWTLALPVGLTDSVPSVARGNVEPIRRRRWASVLWPLWALGFAFLEEAC